MAPPTDDNGITRWNQNQVIELLLCEFVVSKIICVTKNCIYNIFANIMRNHANESVHVSKSNTYDSLTADVERARFYAGDNWASSRAS